MEKVLLYLFFLGLLFSNSQAHAVAFSPNAMVKVAIHNVQNENTVNHGVSKKKPFSHKADLLNDYDDNEESECDDYDTSVKGKFYDTNTLSFNSNQLTADYSSKTLCYKIYNYINFSRIPRFNYISLGVFRI